MITRSSQLVRYAWRRQRTGLLLYCWLALADSAAWHGDATSRATLSASGLQFGSRLRIGHAQQMDGQIIKPSFTDTSDWEAADSAVVVYESGWDTPPADLLDILYQLVHIRYTAAISGETPSATRGPVKFERVDGAVSVSYDTSGMSGSSSAGGSKIDPILGNFTTNLDYYRSDRAIG